MTGQQLKNSILQMAVQGKLVPQDPNDEPASVLLERIRKEKERLVKEKKIKPDKNSSVIFRGSDNLPYEKIGKEVRCIADEVPFDIPTSWEWVRLGDVCEYIQRGKSPKYSPIKKYPVIAQKCNQWEGFSIEKAQFITPESLCSYSEERFLQNEDLLWNSTGLGTLGRMAIYRTALNPYGIAVADSHVTVIRALKQLVSAQYLYFYFTNPTVQNVIEEQASGSTKQKELAQETVKNYLVPIPPLAEQQRIVSKAIEVFPYVEEYSRKENAISMLNASLPVLLKKSILQQAIQGKLVPQDPNDEPANILLERIRKEKAQLVKEGKLKPDKHESVIFRRDNSHYEKLDGKERCIDDEIPYEIPENWAWTRLHNIAAKITDGEHKTPQREPKFCGYYLLSARNILDTGIQLQNVDYINKDEYSKIAKRCNPRRGDILLSCSGSVGRCCIINDDNQYAMVRSAAMISPISVNADYLLAVIQSSCVQKQIEDRKKQTAQANLFQDAIRNLLIPFPPLKEQRRICEKLKMIRTLLPIDD